VMVVPDGDVSVTVRFAGWSTWAADWVEMVEIDARSAARWESCMLSKREASSHRRRIRVDGAFTATDAVVMHTLASLRGAP